MSKFSRSEQADIYKLTDVLDQMHGPEAKAMVLKHLGGFDDEQISSELGVEPEEARLLAVRGLMQAKELFFK